MERFTITELEAGQRIDAYLARRLELSRGRVQAMLKSGEIICNAAPARGSQTIKHGDKIFIEPVAVATITVVPPQLELLYQDDDVVVINKPAGIAVHPGSGTRHPTIADALKRLTTDPDPERPGIVHRLDRDTSGVMIAARTPEAKMYLMKQFHDRLVEKVYLALVVGRVRPVEAIINLPLARSASDPLRRAPHALGKAAETRYLVRDEFNGFSLVGCYPLTGRTHQIRAHFAAIGHPIAGDHRYGAPRDTPPGLTRQFLHAEELTFVLPSGRRATFTAPLSVDLTRCLKTLRESV